MLSAIIQNTEAQRTRSFRPRTLSVISVPLCFKSFLAEKMEGLTRELATQFHESEKLQSRISPLNGWTASLATHKRDSIRDSFNHDLAT